MIGILVGVLEIKPQKYSGFGLELTLKSPDLLQGFLFTAVFLCYSAMFGWFFIYSAWVIPSNKIFYRKSIYTALGSKKILRGLTTAQIKIRKNLARILHAFRIILLLILLFLPAIHILLFYRNVVWSAFREFF